MATDGAHLNPPLLAIEDELTEIRRLLTVMANNAGSDQANIALETIVYKYHANLLRLNELLATHDIVRVPIRPPDPDQLQQIQHLLRENDELVNKLQKFENDMDLLHQVNADWDNQYKRNNANHLKEKQQLESGIRELQNKIELLSTIRAGDSHTPSQEQLNLSLEKEEAVNRVRELTQANNKLRKRLETQEQLLQDDEQNAEAVDKMLKELKDKYKQKEADEARHISEFNLLLSRYDELKDQHEIVKLSEQENSTKLKKTEDNLKSRTEDVDKAKKEYKALQAKVILGLLGEEKTDPKKDPEKKKKVRLYSRRPYLADQYQPDLLDFYEPDIDIMTHGSRKYRTPFLSRLSNWDQDFETLDYPRFGHKGRSYFAIDSD